MEKSQANAFVPDGFPQGPGAFNFIHRDPQLIHSRFPILLWINFLFQDIYGILKGLVLLHIRSDLVDTVDNGGMIPSSHGLSDLLEGAGSHVAAQVHGNLAGISDLLVALLGQEV